MTGPTWGDSPPGGRVAGGTPARRPDQLLQPVSRSGTGPAPQSQIFIGKLVVIFGSGPSTGLFVYNGTPKGPVPGPANPPILAITTAATDPYGNTVTPSAITDSGMPFLIYSGTPAKGSLVGALAPAAITDSFGNIVPAGFNFGTWDAVTGSLDQHFGVNLSGDIFLVNSAGKTIYHGRSSDGGFFWYNTSGQGAGNLLVSLVPAATIDPAGNTVPLGGLSLYGTSGQLIAVTLSSGVPFIILATGVSEEGTAANIQALVTSPGASEIMNLFVVGPQGTVHNDLASVILSSAAKDGSLTAGGALNYTDTSLAEHLFVEWGINGAKVFSALSGDSNTYQPERLMNTPGGALTVNQTTFTQQVLPTLVIGVGTYVYKAQINATPNQAAGQQRYEFAGSVTAGMRIEFTTIVQAGPFNAGGAGEVTALVSPYTDTAAGSTANRVTTVCGTITATVAGTFALFAATNNVADTFIIRQSGTFQELYPVGPP
jgi:hypothetical protein